MPIVISLLDEKEEDCTFACKDENICSSNSLNEIEQTFMPDTEFGNIEAKNEEDNAQHNVLEEIATEHDAPNIVPTEMATEHDAQHNVPEEIATEHDAPNIVPEEIVVENDAQHNVPEEIVVENDAPDIVPTEMATEHDARRNVPEEIIVEDGTQNISIPEEFDKDYYNRYYYEHLSGKKRGRPIGTYKHRTENNVCEYSPNQPPEVNCQSSYYSGNGDVLEELHDIDWDALEYKLLM
jgi:hypothetical protein